MADVGDGGGNANQEDGDWDPHLFAGPPWEQPEPDGEPVEQQAEPPVGALPRDPRWENGALLTNAEKISLIEEYQSERAQDLRGVTAAGLGVFIKEKGVQLAKGFLGSRFLDGTPFKISRCLVVRR